MDWLQLSRQLELLTVDQLANYLKTMISYFTGYSSPHLPMHTSLDGMDGESILLNITVTTHEPLMMISLRFLNGKEPVADVDNVLRSCFSDYEHFSDDDDTLFSFRRLSSFSSCHGAEDCYIMDRRQALVRLCVMVQLVRTFESYRTIHPLKSFSSSWRN